MGTRNGQCGMIGAGMVCGKGWDAQAILSRFSLAHGLGEIALREFYSGTIADL